MKKINTLRKRKNNARIGWWITEDLKAVIQRKAAAENLSVSGHLRKVIEIYLAGS